MSHVHVYRCVLFCMSVVCASCACSVLCVAYECSCYLHACILAFIKKDASAVALKHVD